MWGFLSLVMLRIWAPMSTTHDGNHSWQIILITANQDRAVPAPSLGIQIFNNIFYTKYPMPLITAESGSLTDFQSDYNLFYCETGEPVFSIDGALRTLEEWQVLGFDTHSVVLDPRFIDLVDFIPTMADRCPSLCEGSM